MPSNQDIAPSGSQLAQLPLLTLYLTERCNSRCVSCDYWRHGRTDIDLETVARLLPDLQRLRTRVVLISGGEPLVHPQWASIARLLKEQGLQLWLLTSGLSLAKHVGRVTQLFAAVTVSLDGADAATYMAIRGVDAFDKVCAGIRAAGAAGVPVSIRVTVQRANFRQLPALVRLARELGARQTSFVAVDVANPHAFGRHERFDAGPALQREDLPVFERVLSAMERDFADEFHTGRIAEKSQKLRRLHQYFSAVCAIGDYPPVRCNAPEFSAVIGAGRQVNPCFFIEGPQQMSMSADLSATLNSAAMTALRSDIKAGARAECATCVCSLWREPGQRSVNDFLVHHSHA